MSYQVPEPVTRFPYAPAPSVVTNPSSLQQSLCGIVSASLGNEWKFVELRDLEENGKKPPIHLKYGSGPLELVFKRGCLPDVWDYLLHHSEGEFHSYDGGHRLADMIEKAVLQNSLSLPNGHVFSSVDVAWAWKNGSNRDPYQIVVKLWFHDEQRHRHNLPSEYGLVLVPLVGPEELDGEKVRILEQMMFE